MTDLVGSASADEATILADLSRLTPEPEALPALLETLGYRPQPLGDGWFADGSPVAPVLLFRLYHGAALADGRRQLIGRHIARSATIAGALCTLRRVAIRPALLFLETAQQAPRAIAGRCVVSLEGGVVPRIWRNCFGSFDLLVRVVGKPPHPGQPNMAVNAIEGAIPVINALMQLKADLKQRARQRPLIAEAPLLPRLTLSAAHGGWSGSVLPTLFDIIVNRRYDPAENMPDAMAEIRAVALAAGSQAIRVDTSLSDHREPASDPDVGRRTREEVALAFGWGWPQVPFCSTPSLVAGSVLLGGLERPGLDASAETATVAMDEVLAFARSLQALLTEW